MTGDRAKGGVDVLVRVRGRGEFDTGPTAIRLVTVSYTEIGMLLDLRWSSNQISQFRTSRNEIQTPAFEIKVEGHVDGVQIFLHHTNLDQ